MILDHHSKGQSLMKRAGYAFGQQRIEEFKKIADASLFDIAFCKCKDPRISCSCPRARKIPCLEISFVLDQRAERNMCIGSIDKEDSAILEKRENRKRKSQDHLIKVKNPGSSACNDEDSTSNQQVPTSGTDSDFDAPIKPKVSAQMRVPLPHLASAAYRTNVSARKAALIAT